ncbi:hypothetical protein AK812_SmicGene27947 [Symbiodinium microadriaticum]|uniref:Uncharacterized protein n=1 Tax=Symbiodinium microadriaticum TaxID=2951 RepID=A0A1Q9D5G9_SYMMI|nr:hypothetical protein AK812_SmicGene27947 [Symbiodinium microadriaticum]
MRLQDCCGRHSKATRDRQLQRCLRLWQAATAERQVLDMAWVAWQLFHSSLCLLRLRRCFWLWRRQKAWRSEGGVVKQVIASWRQRASLATAALPLRAWHGLLCRRRRWRPFGACLLDRWRSATFEARGMKRKGLAAWKRSLQLARRCRLRKALTAWHFVQMLRRQRLQLAEAVHRSWASAVDARKSFAIRMRHFWRCCERSLVLAAEANARVAARCLSAWRRRARRRRRHAAGLQAIRLQPLRRAFRGLHAACRFQGRQRQLVQVLNNLTHLAAGQLRCAFARPGVLKKRAQKHPAVLVLVPCSDSMKLRRWISWPLPLLLATLALCSLLQVLSIVAASIRQYRLGDAEGYRILLNMTNSSLQLAGLFVFVHRRQDISQDPLGCLTGELIGASWVSTYCYGTMHLLFATAVPRTCAGSWFAVPSMAFLTLRTILYLTTLWLQMRLMGMRLGVLTGLMVCVFVVGALTSCITIACAVVRCGFAPGSQLTFQNLSVFGRSMTQGVASVATAGLGTAACCGIGRLWVRAGRLVKQCRGYSKAEAVWAHSVLGRFLFSTAIACLVSTLALATECFTVLYEYDFHDQRYLQLHERSMLPQLTVVSSIFFVVMVLASAWNRIFVLAILQPTQPNIIRAKTLERPPMAPIASDRSLAWHSAVEDLANRSLSVSELVDFYGQLGTGRAMPHFCPSASTTADVVRQAIIPLSRQGWTGSFFTAKECCGRHPPKRMVTHCWSNLFLHLVASVVSDALDEGEYKEMADSLASGQLQEVQNRLHAAGADDVRYWICAFCVNQHASICNGFGPPPADPRMYEEWDLKRRDCVTGLPYPLCDCKHPKYLNDAEEMCELNKFDDVIDFLHRTVPEFAQVVSVDIKYEVFERAWCVAELVRAFYCHIPQRVLLHSDKFLDIEEEEQQVYTLLTTLTVRNCKASRAEDKEMVLSKIPDIQTFDEQLQYVIFGQRGLLKRRLAGLGLLSAAKRVTLRAAKSVDLRDVRELSDLSESAHSSSESDSIVSAVLQTWLTVVTQAAYSEEEQPNAVAD